MLAKNHKKKTQERYGKFNFGGVQHVEIFLSGGPEAGKSFAPGFQFGSHRLRDRSLSHRNTAGRALAGAPVLPASGGHDNTVPVDFGSGP